VKRLKEDALRPTEDLQSTFELALSIYRGDTTGSPNPDQAQGIWETNARRGHTKSMIWLGHLFMSDRGEGNTPRQAFQWYITAAKAGDHEAMVLLAEDHFRDTGYEPDIAKGKHWFSIAHSLGNPIARDLMLQLERENLASKGWLQRVVARFKVWR
jgi:TPR repeat protein